MEVRAAEAAKPIKQSRKVVTIPYNYHNWVANRNTIFAPYVKIFTQAGSCFGSLAKGNTLESWPVITGAADRNGCLTAASGGGCDGSIPAVPVPNATSGSSNPVS